jgi:multicomponent Na+:H+ antiporter subunit D
MARMIGGTYDLKKLGHLYRGYPLLALLFLIPAFSLAGIPPLSGFWAKLALLQAGLEAHQYFIVLVALMVSILTLFSMTKIWAEAFWKDSPVYNVAVAESAVQAIPRRTARLLVLPIAALVILVVVLGLAAGPFVDLAFAAGEQLRNPDLYIQAVLGGT